MLPDLRTARRLLAVGMLYVGVPAVLLGGVLLLGALTLLEESK